MKPKNLKSNQPSLEEAAELRRRLLTLLHKSQASHVGTCLSVVEILLAVYKNVDLERIRNWTDDRDRVVVSKGHSAAALYTVLNHFGLLSDEELETYHKNNYRLGGHVTSTVTCVEHSTGALGHGLSVAVGIGLGLRNKKAGSRVFVIVGDGELHEGSNWEAVHSAAHLKLGNLCLLVDFNKLSGIGKTNDCCNLEPLKSKLESFGFETFEVNGHNQDEIDAMIRKTIDSERPVAIICHTIKGKGVSFMENNNVWHYRPLNKEDYEKAMLEIRVGK
jgi:transketolase